MKLAERDLDAHRNIMHRKPVLPSVPGIRVRIGGAYTKPQPAPSLDQDWLQSILLAKVKK